MVDQNKPWLKAPREGFNTRGRFVAGNQVSRGNRGNHYPKSLRQRCVESITVEQVREVMDTLRRKALGEGDMAAARHWLEYVLGLAPGHRDQRPRPQLARHERDYAGTHVRHR